MRYSLHALVALIVVLGFGSAARAVTLHTLVWTGTTGSGATGSNVISALPGDVLTLDLLLFSNEPIFGWDLFLIGSERVSPVSGEECPAGSSSGSSFNQVAGTCTTDVFQDIQPADPGVEVSGTSVRGYDGLSLTSVSTLLFPLFIGRAVFVANDTGSVSLIDADACPEGQGCADIFDPLATATVFVPEPHTLGLVGIGLAALAVLRSPRRAASPR